MRTASAFVLLLTIGAPMAALAQSHSKDDEAACSPDVMRLCQQYIPNRDHIVACLTDRKRELSPDCSRVFSRPPAQRSAEEERRRRRKPASHAPN